MKTKLLYLEDTYCFAVHAHCVDSGVDERGPYLILDETLFYPQGGGQPADSGVISISGVELPVQFAGFVEGAVRHYVEAVPSGLAAGTPAELHVDEASRLHHARLHTAGHLIAGALEGLMPSWKAVKGHHSTDSAYVEFEGTLPEEARASALASLEEALAKAVAAALSVDSRLIDAEELAQLGIALPPHLPEGKPLRVVTIEGYPPVPCGGTHIANTQALSGLTVSKLKAKRGCIRVSYAAP